MTDRLRMTGGRLARAIYISEYRCVDLSALALLNTPVGVKQNADVLRVD